MQKPLLLTAETMPDCVATAAMAASELGWSVKLAPHAQPLNLVEVFGNGGNRERTLYVIGTFWKAQLPALCAQFARVLIYTFGEELGVGEVPKNCSPFCDTKRIGAAEWLLRVQDDVCDTSRINQELLSLINVRCFGTTNERVEAFFIGVKDYVTTDGLDMLTVFTRLFHNSMLTVSEVTALGRKLLSNHRGMAKERVRKCALVFPAQRIAMVEAPELLNLTHAALLGAFPNIHYSIVWYLTPSGPDANAEEPTMVVSVRACNDNTNSALTLVSSIGKGNAGGSTTAAGTRGPFQKTWAELMECIKKM